MKRLVLIFAVAFLAIGMTMAQNAQRPGNKNMDPKERAERMTERMAKEYTLNDSQKQQLKEANLALMEKMGEMPMRQELTGAQRAEKKAAMEKKRTEMKAAHEAYDAQLQKIMTSEQYAAYSAKKASRHQGEKK